WVREMSLRPEYRGRRWDEVEPELQREWGERYPTAPWDAFLDRAQDLWDELMLEPGATVHRGEEPR
ncbi:MAG TPA: hypothetical protein VFM93_14825, partial [Candidatus Limnocylindria bacterium]|nr:hypothetical protein [Candidatus Limnocylindria bacterium]